MNNRLLRNWTRATVLAAMMFAVNAGAAPEVLDGVVAVVNGKVITYSEVREALFPVLAQLQRDYRGAELDEKIRTAQMDALNSLIDRRLIVEEFKTKGYTIPPTTVDQEINRVIASQFGGSRERFIKTLQAENMTLSEYREQTLEQIIIQAMRSRRAQGATVVSPYKMEKYYQDHLDEFAVEDQVKLRMIFIKKNADDTDAGRQLAETIVDKLKKGESFAELAKTYSNADEAKQGGDWGWVSKDVLRKELNAVAFNLAAGQHSDIIETAEGYYLLQVEDVKSAHTKPLDEVRDEIERALLQEQRAKMQEEWVKELRAKAFIRLY